MKKEKKQIKKNKEQNGTLRGKKVSLKDLKSIKGGAVPRTGISISDDE